uniref:Uncharacterized protein n=1 Tax=Cacopsylla melanoneura TaxID=428564 RepID=A0A8D8QMR6_9HEMI
MTKHQPSCKGGNGAHHHCCSNRHTTGGGAVNHRPLHHCSNTHTPLDHRRQWRICECQLKTHLTRMYNNMSVNRPGPGSDAGTLFGRRNCPPVMNFMICSLLPTSTTIKQYSCRD